MSMRSTCFSIKLRTAIRPSGLRGAVLKEFNSFQSSYESFRKCIRISIRLSRCPILLSSGRLEQAVENEMPIGALLSTTSYNGIPLVAVPGDLSARIRVVLPCHFIVFHFSVIRIGRYMPVHSSFHINKPNSSLKLSRCFISKAAIAITYLQICKFLTLKKPIGSRYFISEYGQVHSRFISCEKLL